MDVFKQTERDHSSDEPSRFVKLFVRYSVLSFARIEQRSDKDSEKLMKTYIYRHVLVRARHGTLIRRDEENHNINYFNWITSHKWAGDLVSSLN